VYSEKELGLRYESTVPSGEPVVMIDAINHAMAEEMERDAKVIVFGEDVAGDKGGVFTATRGLTDKFGWDRCYNTPIAEASIVGTACGLSVQGFKPVIEIQFGD
jgi:2-oxoisovalerate dehydrogenase E1 component